jgi:hypothetical protein
MSVSRTVGRGVGDRGRIGRLYVLVTLSTSPDSRREGTTGAHWCDVRLDARGAGGGGFDIGGLSGARSVLTNWSGESCILKEEYSHD